jgi:hypothetical protein
MILAHISFIAEGTGLRFELRVVVRELGHDTTIPSYRNMVLEVYNTLESRHGHKVHGSGRVS